MPFFRGYDFFHVHLRVWRQACRNEKEISKIKMKKNEKMKLKLKKEEVEVQEKAWPLINLVGLTLFPSSSWHICPQSTPQLKGLRMDHKSRSLELSRKDSKPRRISNVEAFSVAHCLSEGRVDRFPSRTGTRQVLRKDHGSAGGYRNTELPRSSGASR